MPDIQIRYDDGVAYERMMGTWSRAAGEIFLDWVAPSCGLRWIDVGCGAGPFTELLIERCAPAEVEGVDPSDARLFFARARSLGHTAGRCTVASFLGREVRRRLGLPPAGERSGCGCRPPDRRRRHVEMAEWPQLHNRCRAGWGLYLITRELPHERKGTFLVGPPVRSQPRLHRPIGSVNHSRYFGFVSMRGRIR
jgi:SAM-dependent methyltransferase